MCWGLGALSVAATTACQHNAPLYAPQVLEQRRAAEQGGKAGGDALAYRQFLQLFVPAFCRASNNLLDLQVRGLGLGQGQGQGGEWSGRGGGLRLQGWAIQ